MTIWILALVFLSCSAAAGFCFGAIRTACSLLGLLVGAMLAFPLAHYMTAVVGWCGVKNPIAVWVAGPMAVFVVVLLAFKIIGLTAHQKVSVYYKYKAGDLRQGLWNRMNVRVGLCLGLLNGAIYSVLAALVLCLPGYATTQLVMGDDAGWLVKTFNLFARDAQSSGMNRILGAINPLPPDFYPAMDMAGLLYHNDLLEARLGRYPGFMALGERPEYQAFATDKAYLELRQQQKPVMDIIHHPAAQNIINNPNLLQELLGIVIPNLADLETFLRTGHSPKFDGEKIVGRWSFNLNGALRLLRSDRPNLKPSEMAVLKQAVLLSFARTTLMAAPGGEVYVKDYGTLTYPEAAAAPGAAATPLPPGAGVPPGASAAPAGGRGGRGGRGGARGGQPTPQVPQVARGRGAVPIRVPLAPPKVTLEAFTGHWAAKDGKYQFTFQGKPGMDGSVDGDLLTIKGDKLPLTFDRDF